MSDKLAKPKLWIMIGSTDQSPKLFLTTQNTHYSTSQTKGGSIMFDEKQQHKRLEEWELLYQKLKWALLKRRKPEKVQLLEKDYEVFIKEAEAAYALGQDFVPSALPVFKTNIWAEFLSDYANMLECGGDESHEAKRRLINYFAWKKALIKQGRVIGPKQS